MPSCKQFKKIILFKIYFIQKKFNNYTTDNVLTPDAINVA